jgi:flagellar protein FliJ
MLHSSVNASGFGELARDLFLSASQFGFELGVSNMKSRETALRLKRFEADEKARNVADLEGMIRDFEGMAYDLERQIKAEEDRTGVRDPQNFAYSTFAKSARQRHENLLNSIEGLREKYEAAVKERDEAMEQAELATSSADRATGSKQCQQDAVHEAPAGSTSA